MRRAGGTESRTVEPSVRHGENLPEQLRRMDLGVAR